MRRLLCAILSFWICAAVMTLAPGCGGTGDSLTTQKFAKDEAKDAEKALEEEAESPNILKFEPNLALWSLVVFGVLFGVLYRFAWKPLIKALDEREEHHERMLHDTEAARAESERLLAEHKKRLDDAQDEIKSMIENGKREGEALAESIVSKARDEADAYKKQAKNEIAAATDQALSEVWTKATDLAVSVAGKVLSKNLTDDDRKRLVASAIESMPVAHANGSAKAGGGRA